MPTRVLARRMVALQACRILHKSGELDDQLMPIGKSKCIREHPNTSLRTQVHTYTHSSAPARVHVHPHGLGTSRRSQVHTNTLNYINKH